MSLLRSVPRRQVRCRVSLCKCFRLCVHALLTNPNAVFVAPRLPVVSWECQCLFLLSCMVAGSSRSHELIRFMVSWTSSFFKRRPARGARKIARRSLVLVLLVDIFCRFVRWVFASRFWRDVSQSCSRWCNSMVSMMLLVILASKHPSWSQGGVWVSKF